MTEPCSEKVNIEKLFAFHEDKMKQLHVMENRQIEIQGDISHIKGRIDNGMGKTIEEVSKRLISIMPILERHNSLEKRLEDLFWSIVKVLVVAILGIIVWAASHGWKI